MKKRNIIGMSLVSLLGVGAAVFFCKTNRNLLKLNEKKVNKFKNYYSMLNEWLKLKQNGKSLQEYFIDNGYKTIAIYGMGEMGNRLYDELKDSSVKIIYVTDKNAEYVDCKVDVLGLEQEFPEVDALVVTATFAFDEVVEKLENKVTCPIVSLEDVIYGI